MAKEEIIIKLNMLEQKAEEKRQQILEVDRQIEDLSGLKHSLEKLGESKEKEMLSSLGRGVFLKTKIDDSKVFVNVGSRVLVRKTFKEGVEIIDKQLLGLEEIKSHLMSEIEEINAGLYELLEEAQKESGTD